MSIFKRLFKSGGHRAPEVPGPPIDRLPEVDRAKCKYGGELVEIQGVVASTWTGGSVHSDGYGVHIFCFAAWRRVGQPLIQRKLTVLRPVSPAEVGSTSTLGYSIHRLNVLLSEDETRAIVAGVAKLDDEDAELEAVSRELQKPVVVSAAGIGDLTLDRDLSCFTARSEWNGEAVEINLDVEDDLEVGSGLVVLEELFGAQKEWSRRVQEYAVREVLPIKNKHWLGDDEEEVTAEQLLARMKLLCISANPDGQFSFYHGDGGLFGDHAISIAGSLEEGLIEFDLPG